MSDPQAVFYEAFAGLDRLAPGSDASTLRALTIVRQHVEPRRILDLGCGAGAQTMALARNSAAEIIAVDAHAPFLRALESRAKEEGFPERIRTIEASMADLAGRIESGSIDLVWAEGSIYTIGFDSGLRAFRDTLRTGGALACTELTWLTQEPSEEASVFWREGYPAMRSLDANLAAAAAAGFGCIGHFILPSADWLDMYYDPLEERLTQLREKYRGDAEARGVLATIQSEIDLYRRRSSEYGYAFYVLLNLGA